MLTIQLDELNLLGSEFNGSVMDISVTVTWWVEFLKHKTPRVLGSKALFLPPRKCTEGSNRYRELISELRLNLLLYMKREQATCYYLALPLTPMPGYLEHFCSHESRTTHECPMAREGSSQASQLFSIPPFTIRDAFQFASMKHLFVTIFL